MPPRHLMIPGLQRRHIEGGWLASLREYVPRQSARLICSFPATVAVTETTILTGNPPVRHGVLFEGEESRVPGLIDAVHSRLDTFLETSDPVTALIRLDAELRRILAARSADQLLLVSGAPPGQERTRQVELSTDGLEEAGFELRIDDAFALCTPKQGSIPLPKPLLERWLDCPGVERVLSPAADSAGAWMAPTDRGWFILAEPGCSFSAGPSGFGHREPAPGSEAVLLAFGPRWAEDWPDAVHDWRIAPTLLSAAGVMPRTAQEAMRHSTIDLTMNVYTDPALLDVAGAIESLPDLPIDRGQPSGRPLRSERKPGEDGNLQFAPKFAPNTGRSGQSGTIPVKMAVPDDPPPALLSRAVKSCYDNSKGPLSRRDNDPFKVGATGFEPATSASRTQRSTKLSHAPMGIRATGDRTGGRRTHRSVLPTRVHCRHTS